MVRELRKSSEPVIPIRRGEPVADRRSDALPFPEQHLGLAGPRRLRELIRTYGHWVKRTRGLSPNDDLRWIAFEAGLGEKVDRRDGEPLHILSAEIVDGLPEELAHLHPQSVVVRQSGTHRIGVSDQNDARADNIRRIPI